ncbi:MAG: hypothetical protein JJW03_05180 [Desulfosarcina sp.]|nr:hypothetical protein [Desulfobacterales bacterium]
MSENQTKEQDLCRAMAMFTDGKMNLVDAIDGYKEMSLNSFTAEGANLLIKLNGLLEYWGDLEDAYQDTIDDAARFSGLDITEIGYEEIKRN